MVAGWNEHWAQAAARRAIVLEVGIAGPKPIVGLQTLSTLR